AVNYYDTAFEPPTRTQHLDGNAWTIDPSANATTYINELLDVATVSPAEAWTVGHSAGLFTFKTLSLHRTGSCPASAMHVSSIVPHKGRNAVNASVAIADGAGAPVP